MEFNLKPIGFMRSGKRLKFETLHQPDHDLDETNTIELLPKMNFEQALKDLGGFDRIWLVWCFDRNKGWKPQVMPPRGGKVKRGVFATRSPHRPNPIGLTVVKLLGIKGRKIIVGPVDLLDGTPILDIKPYIPEHDSFPESSIGWLGEALQEVRSGDYTVKLGALAERQAKWLRREWGVDFIQRARELLSIDPKPHRTRRISRTKSGFMIGCGAWRAYFSVRNKKVTIDKLAAGYPRRSLLSPGYTEIPDRDAQLAFSDKFE